ncbi:MAG: hypothetical protein J1F39_05070, partial [Clostridiales bacterium]|nr:hypothetical protein [Clostridiales bacterium]
MKLKKLFAFVLAACAALALGVGLIACDGETNPDPKPDPKPGPTEKTISYQYTGANDELYGYGWAYYVMLNL